LNEFWEEIMAHQKIEGNANLVRDTNNGAILNINRNEFAKAKLARAQRHKKEQEFVELQDEVSEIKSMLKQLLEKS
tara:strand:+ start:156 stop:383 length:228 start_codon:yes stop_codon:yes gene_type:complete